MVVNPSANPATSSSPNLSPTPKANLAASPSSSANPGAGPGASSSANPKCQPQPQSPVPVLPLFASALTCHLVAGQVEQWIENAGVKEIRKKIGYRRYIQEGEPNFSAARESIWAIWSLVRHSSENSGEESLSCRAAWTSSSEENCGR